MSSFQDEHEAYYKSPAGVELLTNISGMLDDNHRKAENEPELSRDYMQRAKGNREVLDLINSLMTGIKKNR